MNHNKHYGTIAHWFGEMSRGSIICDESSQRIFANRQSLHPDYQEPEPDTVLAFKLKRKTTAPSQGMSSVSIRVIKTMTARSLR